MMSWHEDFAERMQRFQELKPAPGRAVSIKVRVTAGCFHREHSPSAYELIDQFLRDLPKDGGPLSLEEHESGPEILTWVAEGVTIVAGVVYLLDCILKARSKGIKLGDRSEGDLELLVRKHDALGYRERNVMRATRSQELTKGELEKLLRDALAELLRDK